MPCCCIPMLRKNPLFLFSNRPWPWTATGLTCLIAVADAVILESRSCCCILMMRKAQLFLFSFNRPQTVTGLTCLIAICLLVLFACCHYLLLVAFCLMVLWCYGKTCCMVLRMPQDMNMYHLPVTLMRYRSCLTCSCKNYSLTPCMIIS